MTAALAEHLVQCRRARGRRFRLLMVRDAVGTFVAMHIITVLTLSVTAWVLLSHAA